MAFGSGQGANGMECPVQKGTAVDEKDLFFIRPLFRHLYWGPFWIGNCFKFKGIYTIFLPKGEVYLWHEGKTQEKTNQDLSLLPGPVQVLLAVPVRVCHVPGMHV